MPHKVPKIIVASHERSGTHFLMNAIADNYGYISDPWIDIDWPQVKNPYASENFCYFLEQFQGKGVISTFKTHFPASFLEPVIDLILDEFQVFYIYRDVIATMNSFSRHISGFDWDMGPTADSGRELMSMQPSGALLRYQAKQFASLLERWRQHVYSWTKGLTAERRAKIIYVRYKDLNERFDETIRSIGDRLGCFVVNTVRPDKNDRVILPEEKNANVG